ncbi:hypothetical protein FB479_103707 [Brevibacillus sp. AG162]|nr:hypothetical protein FB479_103707 [Brevibacillus sp. AG162]
MLSTFAEIEHEHLVFLAPQSMVSVVRTDLAHRSIIAKDVCIGFLSWEEVLERMLQVHLEDAPPYQKLIMQDIQALLDRKGFARFTGFDKGIAELDVTKEVYEYRTQENDRSAGLPWRFQRRIELPKRKALFPLQQNFCAGSLTPKQMAG